ncbi:hypothetical protein JTE90_014664 [Oedothorax gibbosus]|uniref:Uncharacterized protein n=1 Tax=Oedothorax gibbosus TaxID=931172 RepID=A0AAV6VB12_9ARAC|nr:hypothetical protein JTE90_014664 [Oedothorax gibbosus]
MCDFSLDRRHRKRNKSQSSTKLALPIDWRHCKRSNSQSSSETRTSSFIRPRIGPRGLNTFFRVNECIVIDTEALVVELFNTRNKIDLRSSQ